MNLEQYSYCSRFITESAQDYLHSGCAQAIVQRDVKTTNILLNEHYEAKVADFGLSKSLPIRESHVSTIVAGTPGYLDPEYYRTGWLTTNSDVYSYGVVLLELLTNQPVVDQSREQDHIGGWVGLKLTNGGDISTIMDPRPRNYNSGSARQYVELAMACLNPSSSERPTMSQVVDELKQCLASELSTRAGPSRDTDMDS
ncbi:PREDICTED: probable LRR receptor-like serine/threonine-protein kinase At1g51820 [Camelina sativa]|uniref:Probable LRR receptor-like serine/threonine-protein kinase At1g51820 n=1 Tax=Camelina sativa TaxID=90675 RepID=A0ABM1R9J6_CAMSA|nr:PREDICTED: probable LRR receptor-like serine/threonine-protein kinase At1g51820 [Camelina sativa]